MQEMLVPSLAGELRSLMLRRNYACVLQKNPKKARLSQRCDVMLSSWWVPSPRCEERAWSAWHGSIWLCHTAFVLLWAPQRRAKGTEAKGKSLMWQEVLWWGPWAPLDSKHMKCVSGFRKDLCEYLWAHPDSRLSRWSRWVPTAGGRPQGPLPEGSPSCSPLFLETSQLGHGRPLPPPSHPADSLLVILLPPFSLLFLGWGCPARLVLL